jgi:hypothetical protein
VEQRKTISGRTESVPNRKWTALSARTKAPDFLFGTLSILPLILHHRLAFVTL